MESSLKAKAGGGAEAAFESFLQTYTASTGKAIGPKDRKALLAEFRQFLITRTKKKKPNTAR
jgi:hypothetical protein